MMQGILMGIGLGILLVAGILCLSSHYKNNIPLASMTGTIMGPLGGVIYTTGSYIQFQEREFQKACWINCGIMAATLVPACFLMKPSEIYGRLSTQAPEESTRIWKEKDTLLFTLGYLCLFFGLFTWPAYIVLMIASTPQHEFPTSPTVVLMITYGVSILTAPIMTSGLVLRTNGALNTFILAAVAVGASFIFPSQAPSLLAFELWCTPYAVGLGAVLGLYIRVTSIFHFSDATRPFDRPARISALLTLVGIVAAAGVVTTAALVEMDDGGFKIAMLINGIVVMAGGLLMWVGRWFRIGSRVWFCI
ncbi:uncharacterized protein BDR25DRAFT_304888 [Lindgomyces ingoldianus]|uniref:Uncharacterized protein n=1 Tax=Lindgomyces ingoldianus TaxID=673940 RepID=A0ACB6QN75_9PLEO|nr:uncharacterized protein BDR25DRAFT_304888 [Lindgomyces ingoldianus]KAF2468429.1 hypothetical protein BDR25DRAFT_304888 [Lindgomyces ingoldianus]